MTSIAASTQAAAHQPRSPLRSGDATLYQTSLSCEHGFEPLRVEGTFPATLRGTLVRNGPARFEAFGKRYSHPFEADGGLCALRLDGDRVLGAHRLIQSAELDAERRAGKPLFGSLASAPRRLLNGLTWQVKNTANTSVMHWQGQLLAMMEASPPTAIDPLDLSTIGATDLAGVVPGAFSAHPHRVPARRATYNFGVRYGHASQLDLFELPDTGPGRRIATIPIGAVMLHDFMATENHLIFLVAPVEVVTWRALLGFHDMRKLFRWRPDRGTEVIVVPIDDPGRTSRFRTDAFLQWHFGGGFEQGDEVAVDFARYPDFSTYAQLENGDVTQGGEITRAFINPRRETIRFERIAAAQGEFPHIDPRYAGQRNRVMWLTQDWANECALVRIDLDSGCEARHDFGSHERPSEALFVPRSPSAPEGDGWLLALILDEAAGASYFGVYDALHLDEGPVARAWLRHHVPMTFHGTWVPAT